MSTHTLTITDTPELVARVVLLKHYLEEGCACTATLRKRYGLTGVAP